ncbi:unnamed protein product [Didymodactylos carnosus]|uniref:Uncharacterized protein n=1 Tax=Didymodactylos carnosus TaxID=1234261 RepID=A0A814QYZ0_9BILA|nr:unnamed protein product [Didymodactylos carnosus]CAF3889626.1 unnamed protein product [Didymodactylos carnosus]
MVSTNFVVIFLTVVGTLLISTNATSHQHNIDALLPQSVVELKQYYDVITNLEKRGIITSDAAAQEKNAYIELASKLVGRKDILTIEEFLTWKQRQLIISFSNVIAILAGVIVVLALTTLVALFIIPVLTHVPVVVWEGLFYIISIYLLIFMNNSWVIFLGCLLFLATLSFTVTLHFSRQKNVGLAMAWICFFVWAAVAVYHQSREAGYLAVMALESSLGFVMFAGELVIMIGFQNESVIPSATVASLISLLIGSILQLQRRSNILTIPFTRPLLFLGTFVYFIGLIILSSRLYSGRQGKYPVYWLLQLITFLSCLAAMFFGPMLELPFIQAIGGTMFVIWLLEKYVEIVPWKSTLIVICGLLGFGVLLYGFAYFLRMYPEYLIFHVYSSK